MHVKQTINKTLVLKSSCQHRRFVCLFRGLLLVIMLNSSVEMQQLGFRCIEYDFSNLTGLLHSLNSFKTRESGLKVNDQLVAYVTRFLAVRLKK